MAAVKMAVLMMLGLCSSAGLIEHAAAQSQGNQLAEGQALAAGQYLEAGEYRLLMQDDCNLVIYQNGNNPLWSTTTDGHGLNCFLAMQHDGNAVVYSSLSGTDAPDVYPVWNSGTCCRDDGDHVLILQLDGNMVIYNKFGTSIYATGT